jgi:eukaryotic translation initiation factor 2-alpha kinase 4
MVFALCQHVQTYLHANNKPPSKSFYDQMLLNQQQLEQKKAMAMQKQRELQRQRDEKAVTALS